MNIFLQVYFPPRRYYRNSPLA